MLLGAAFSAAAGIATTEVAACSLGDAACITTVLSRDGALAITGVPGLAAARRVALTGLARCIYAEKDGVAAGDGARRVVLPGGTLRRTFAAETVRGVSSALDAGCSELPEAADPLRALVDQVSRNPTSAPHLISAPPRLCISARLHSCAHVPMHPCAGGAAHPRWLGAACACGRRRFGSWQRVARSLKHDGSATLARLASLKAQPPRPERRPSRSVAAQ